MEPVIRTENLTYTYSIGTPFEKTAVRNVNLSVNEGELIGIIGHTGSGKSTLIQHFNGLMKPTSGKMYLDGVDIWDKKNSNLRDVRFKAGLVFQYPEYQIFEETVYKDIAFGPKNMGLDEKETDRRVRGTAEMLGISEVLERSPFELSGGQKRRVAIAGVMAMEPKVLILDEPTAGLDPKGRDMVTSQIKEYHKRTNAAVLLVSHSMEDVAEFAEKILVMNKSELFCFDETPEVFKRAAEISEMGLSVPQITRVFGRLKEAGIDIRTDVYTLDFAVKTIKEYLNKHGKGVSDAS